VPVPPLEPVVRPPLERWAPDYLHADPDTVHAHITLLGPFLPREELTPEVLDDLCGFFAGVVPFRFELARLGRFPGDGLVHLVPEPTDPFRALTSELWRRWPQCPPYGGRFADVIPHLSIDHAATPDELAELTAGVAPFVPVTVTAVAAELYWYEPHRSRSLARFPFASGERAPVPAL
jgi:hypothetical protein